MVQDVAFDLLHLGLRLGRVLLRAPVEAEGEGGGDDERAGQRHAPRDAAHVGAA